MPEHFAAAARDREEDSRLLLANSRWTGAIYFARLSFECSLKHHIQQTIRRTPPRTHDVWALARALLRGRIPRPTIILLKQINEVDVEIRYNVRVFTRQDAERFCAMVWGLKRWLQRQL